jgi:hypothetical protein
MELTHTRPFGHLSLDIGLITKIPLEESHTWCGSWTERTKAGWQSAAAGGNEGEGVKEEKEKRQDTPSASPWGKAKPKFHRSTPPDRAGHLGGQD